EQVKQPKIVTFAPLQECLARPTFVISDFAKLDRQDTIHATFQALSAFAAQHDGQLPRPRHEDDAQAVLALAREILASSAVGTSEALDEATAAQVAFNAQGYLAPMAAFIGGFVAQEVLKACSGKFNPTFQHFYFDALECLDPASPPSA